MTNYHLNASSGRVSACRAKSFNTCPFGGAADHSNSPEALRNKYEALHSSFVSVKTPQRSSVPERVAKLRQALNRMPDKLFDDAPKVAAISGAAAAVALSGGLMIHSSHQDYTPVQSEVVSSQVHTYTQTTFVNKAPVIVTVSDTEVQTRVGDETVKVTLDGDRSLQQGSSLTIYDTGNSYSGTRPGGAESLGTDGLIGAAAGVTVFTTALVGSTVLSVYLEQRRWQRSHPYPS